MSSIRSDTLEESAFLLQTVLRPAKPVLLVGAMRPSTALLSDGAQNLADALQLAATPGVRGVLVPCVGRIYAGNEVRKLHPHRLDAFGAGDAGALAALAGGRLQRWRPWPGEGWPQHGSLAPAALCEPGTQARGQAAWAAQASLTEPANPTPQQPALLPLLLAEPPWPRVEWISSHGAQTGALVRALLLQHAQADGTEAALRGLVVAGTGNATVHSALAQALRQAQQAGVLVWRCSRTGTCVPPGPDAAQPLLDGGPYGLLCAPAQGAARAAWHENGPQKGLENAARDFPVTALPAPQARLALQLHLLAQRPV